MRKIFFLMLIFLSFNAFAVCNTTWLRNHTYGYWKFDEAAVPYIDATRHANFTLADTPTRTAASILGFGQDFEDADLNWLNTSKDTVFEKAQYTYNIWLKPETLQTTDTFLSTYYTAASSYGFYFSYLNTGVFDIIIYKNGGNIRATSANTRVLKAGTWQMVTVTYNGTWAQIYLNGTEVAYSATHTTGTAWYSAGNMALTVGEIGYSSNNMDGVADELSFFDDDLPQDCINYLYNSGAPTAYQQYPYTVTSSVPGITALYPNSSTHYGILDAFNNSVILISNITANCTLGNPLYSLYKNTATWHEWRIAGGVAEGTHIITYFCNNSNYWTNSSFNFTIDTTYPTAQINWPIPNGSRIWELATPDFNVSFFDTYLYKANITMRNSSGNIKWYVQNISFSGVDEWWNYTKDDLEFNKTYVSKNSPIPYEDNITIRLLATDTHTATAFLEDVEASVTAKDGKVSTTYEMDYTQFTQTLPDAITTKIIEDSDRWRFEYDTFDNKILGPTTMIIHSDKELDYLPDSPYKCHFVIANKYWYDCEGLTDPKVTKIDSQTYQINFIMDSPKVVTDSIGGLNNITVDYSFILDYSNASIVWNDTDSTENSISFWFNTSEPANMTYHIGDSCKSSNYSNGSQTTHTINHTITLGGLTINTTYWINISNLWDNVIGLGQSHITTGKNSSCFNITTLASQIYVYSFITSSGTYIRGWCNATNVGGTNMNINWTIFRNGLPVNNGSVLNRLSGQMYNLANYTPTLGGDYVFQCLASNITYFDIDNSTTLSLPIWYLSIFNESDLKAITNTDFTIEIVAMNHNWSKIIITNGSSQNISNFPYFDEYEIRYYGNNYRLRGQFIDLTSAVSSNVSLYALKDNESEYIDFYIQDFGLRGIPDVKVGIWRYYSNISSWIEIAKQLTNVEGLTRFYLNKSNAYYKIVLVYKNSTVFTTEGEVLYQTSYYIRTDVNPIYTPLGEVNGDIYLLNSTSPKRFVFEYTDKDSSVSRVCLATWQIGRKGYIINRTNCSTATSGTITHNFTDYTKSYVSVPYVVYTDGNAVNLDDVASYTGINTTQTSFLEMGVLLSLVLLSVLGLGMTYITKNFIIPIITIDAVMVGMMYLDWFVWINWFTLGIIIPSSIVIVYYINKRV